MVQPCGNPDCLYLHDAGTQEDTFTKDEAISTCARYYYFPYIFIVLYYIVFGHTFIAKPVSMKFQFLISNFERERGHILCQAA